VGAGAWEKGSGAGLGARRQGARANPENRVNRAEPDDSGAPVEEAAALAGGEAVDERVAARQVGGAIERALAEMTVEAREVLLLRDVEGLSGPDAAAALALDVPAMKSRLHRARLELKARVEKLLGHSVQEVVR
jgi:RNA polymerase sigma-70 factor (ECF subfamily)